MKIKHWPSKLRTCFSNQNFVSINQWDWVTCEISQQLLIRIVTEGRQRQNILIFQVSVYDKPGALRRLKRAMSFNIDLTRQEMCRQILQLQGMTVAILLGDQQSRNFSNYRLQHLQRNIRQYCLLCVWKLVTIIVYINTAENIRCLFKSNRKTQNAYFLCCQS